MHPDEQKKFLKAIYNIDLLDTSEITSGISHINYKVKTDKGVYVLKKMNRNNKQDEIHEELNYLKYMFESGIPVILPVKTEQGYFIPYGEHLMLLYEFIDHKTDQATYDNIGQYGKIVGKINSLPIASHLKPRPTRRQIWKEFVEKSDEKELVSKFLKKFMPYHEMFSNIELPTSIIHADIWSGNILSDYDDDVKCVLDWESVDIYHRLFELSIVIIGCCYVDEQLNFDMFNQFIKNYQREVELTDTEKNLLYDYLGYSILWCVAWRYVMFNMRKIDKRFYDFHIPMYERFESLESMGRKNFYEKIKL